METRGGERKDPREKKFSSEYEDYEDIILDFRDKLSEMIFSLRKEYDSFLPSIKKDFKQVVVDDETHELPSVVDSSRVFTNTDQIFHGQAQQIESLIEKYKKLLDDYLAHLQTQEDSNIESIRNLLENYFINLLNSLEAEDLINLIKAFFQEHDKSKDFYGFLEEKFNGVIDRIASSSHVAELDIKVTDQGQVVFPEIEPDFPKAESDNVEKKLASKERRKKKQEVLDAIIDTTKRQLEIDLSGLSEGDLIEDLDSDAIVTEALSNRQDK